MKKIYLSLFSALFFFGSGNAQSVEDALRYSFQPINGTARSMAIGGAMTSLGGDISATFVNPAGLGFYRTSEALFTHGWKMNAPKSNYRDINEQRYSNGFALGPMGFVSGFRNPFNPQSSNAFSIAITQTANFNNLISYHGLNNYSSAAEQYVEEIYAASIDQGLNRRGVLNTPAYAHGSSLAISTLLVDSFFNGSPQIEALPKKYLIENGQAVLQSNRVETSGGITEIAIAFANNNQDKLYWGATVGVPIVRYERNTTYTESDPSNDKTNNFNYYTLHDNLKTRGIGLNAKVGIIYRPVDYIRVGAAIHTPSLLGLTDTRTADMTTDTEGYKGVLSAQSTTFTGGLEGKSSYTAITPWRFLLSGSYVFREIEDVTKQKGFITADVEYVGYNNSTFRTGGEFSSSGDDAYYKGLNTIISDYYKGALNFRLGGELKFNTIMARAGFAYYGNPYSYKSLKANKTLLSAGIGYRDKGIFADLTYVYAIQKDVHFPYHLDEKLNTFANVKNTMGTIMFTIGTKL